MDDVLKKYFDGFRRSGKLPPELRGKVDATLFPDLDQLRRMRNYRIGLMAEFPQLGMRLKGAIDELLINKQGEHVVFDFKTRGYPTKEDTHTHYQDQLDLYALLLKKNRMTPADYGYLFFIHPTSFSRGRATFASNIMRVEVKWQDGFAMLEEVKKTIDGSKPRAHRDCEYCMYRSPQAPMF